MAPAELRGATSGIGRPLPTRAGTLAPKDAAYLADRSIETVKRWCTVYGIGRQLHPGAPWRVDPVGLAIVISGDGEALADYQAGRLDSPAVRKYELEGAR